MRCPGDFPVCRTDEDCTSEEGNKVLLHCCNGQCQECCSDEDCAGKGKRCKDYRCFECIENADCPEDSPLCHQHQCVMCWDGKQCPSDKPICLVETCGTECKTYHHCYHSDMPGRVCKDGKCVFCKWDSDCYKGLICIDKKCIEPSEGVSLVEREVQQIVLKDKRLTEEEKKRIAQLGDEAFDIAYNLIAEQLFKCLLRMRAMFIPTCSYEVEKRIKPAVKILVLAATNKHTSKIINLLKAPISCWTKIGMIDWLRKKAPEDDYVPTFLDMLRNDRSGAQRMLPCGEKLLLDGLLNAKDERAVAFSLQLLNDKRANPAYRRAAFARIAETRGERGLKAVLAARDRQRETKVIRHSGIDKLGTQVWKGPEWGYDKYLYHYEVTLIDKREDKNGVLWGLISSMALGSYKDLWISRHDGKKWSEPIFTGTTKKELGKRDWVSAFANNSDITRDRDGDSLTDLVEDRLGTNPDKVDTDEDGLDDSIDKNPLAAPRELNEYEQILAAAFEARFRYIGWRDVPMLLDLPEGVEPMEFMGWDRVIIVCKDGKKHPMDKVVGEGIATAGFSTLTFLDDDPEENGWIREGYKIYWNKDRTEARLSVGAYYGPTDATGFQLHLRKYGKTWVVISCEMYMIS